jgi:hypothetical protein
MLSRILIATSPTISLTLRKPTLGAHRVLGMTFQPASLIKGMEVGFRDGGGTAEDSLAATGGETIDDSSSGERYDSRYGLHSAVN